jgi:hypothetical protein
VNGRAFLAIIRRSLDRRFAATWLLGFGGAFALGTFAPAIMTHTGWLVTLLAIGAPSSSFDRRHNPRRRVSFFAMPLYGRELARALAVEPCFASLAIPLAIILGLASGRHPFAVDTAITILVAVLTSTLVGLSAIVRTGENAALYIALALVAEAAIVTPLVFRPAHPLLFTLPIALALAFVALRAFGETLARYDPVPA